MGDTIDSIIRLPDFHLRAILVALCDDVQTRNKAEEYLKDLQRADTPAKQLARKSLRDIWICVQCKAPFSYQHNTPGSCSYHPGECELDESADCWEVYYNDPDDVFDGLEGNESMMKEFPQGYTYGCCDGIYGSKPCMVGVHEAHPTRVRLTDSAKPGTSSAPVMIPDEEDEDEDEEGTNEEDGEEGSEDDDGHPSKKRKL